MTCVECGKWYMHWQDGVFEPDGIVPGTTIKANKWICKPCKFEDKEEEDEALF